MKQTQNRINMPNFRSRNELREQNDPLKRNIEELRFKMSMQGRKLTIEGMEKLAHDIEAMKFSQEEKNKSFDSVSI